MVGLFLGRKPVRTIGQAQTSVKIGSAVPRG